MASLIVQNKPKSHISEAYKTLRTNIQFSSCDKELKTVLVTSASSSEGKTTIAANLAFTMAQSDKKVILIDCDLRKPAVHKKFEISNQVGLTNLIIEDLKVEDVMVEYKENLYIIPSGTIPPNPSEMLDSQKMRNFLRILKECVDCIIIDTPPVMAVTDAQVLSTMVDGVLLVVVPKKTSKEVLVKTKESLLNVKANIVGVILNKVERKSSKEYEYYYHSNEKHKNKHKKSKKQINKDKKSINVSV